MENVAKVYGALGKAMAQMTLLPKTEEHAQGWKYRGIDSLMNMAHARLDDCHLIVRPEVVGEPRMTKGPLSSKGNEQNVCVVLVRFGFVSTEDGSEFVVGPFVGEALSTSDKASNKAQTAAYKWAFFETFCMPTGGAMADTEASGDEDEEPKGKAEEFKFREEYCEQKSLDSEFKSKITPVLKVKNPD